MEQSPCNPISSEKVGGLRFENVTEGFDNGVREGQGVD